MKTKYKKCLDYIKNNQEELTFYLPEDQDIHLGLPNPFIAPSASSGIYDNDQFYWDSYFIILGLLETNQVEMAKGMVNNLVYLCNRFGIVPSRNRYYNLGTSQPPFLSSMIMEVFAKTKDKKWLEYVAKVAEKELCKYWVDNKKVHKVHKGLSRYCDHLHTDDTAEHESGWDMTSRFDKRCMDFLPVDLNSLLYKYEQDLTLIYKTLKNPDKVEKYKKRAKKRREIINQLMWNNDKGFFFDYDYVNKRQSDFWAISGFYPLWAGLATKAQAKKVLQNIKVFECEGGLASTQKNGLSGDYKQWDYPNGWANQQWIVIKGLLNYGFDDEAKRLAEKWLETNRKVFEKTGTLWEKYNVVTVDIGKSGRYPTQEGFGWTDAVFVKLVGEFNGK